MKRETSRALRLSISTRLALWYGLGLLILLSLFVAFLYAGLHLSLHDEFERQLEADESRLMQAVRTVDGGPKLDVELALRAVALKTDGAAGTYVRLFSAGGTMLFESENFARRSELLASVPNGEPLLMVSRAWDGAPARTRYLALRGDANRIVGWLETTRLESNLHNELHRIRWLLALGILAGAFIAIASGYGMARRALRPVATITAAARRIHAETPGQRLPTGFGVQDELSDLATTLNDLLARLDTSFERERRFRADAAHEMFTPISAMRSELEVAVRKPRDAAYYVEVMTTMQGHVERLSRIVDDLLRLSRAEATLSGGDARCDAREVLVSVANRFRTPAQSRHVAMSIDGRRDPLPVRMDGSHLEAVLENLVDNAVKYTPPGGTVHLTADADGDLVILRVTDTGAGFDADDGSHLFDRFYRADTAAVHSVRGSGLGLSIAKAIVDVYGGAIEAASEGRDRGSCFEVRLKGADASGAGL